jgi:competence protein ComGC
MRSLLVMLLVTMLIVLLIFTAKPCGKDKTYVQQMMTAKDKAEFVSLDAKVNTIKAAMEAYYIDNNEYPELLDDLIPTYIRTREPIIDPWGQPFKLETDDEMNLILVSPGKDRIPETDDDVRRRI